MTDPQKEKIYGDYYGKVYGYLLSRINSTREAEDLAADVFVKIYEKPGTFDEVRASLSTWIYTITRNTLIDYYRTRRVLEEFPEEKEDGTSVEEDICRAETPETLARAPETLDERERDVLVLRFYSGRTLREIAAQMGIS